MEHSSILSSFHHSTYDSRPHWWIFAGSKWGMSYSAVNDVRDSVHASECFDDKCIHLLCFLESQEASETLLLLLITEEVGLNFRMPVHL